MSCTQTLAGLAKDCTPSMGGIVEVALANYADVSSISLDSDEQQISSITMSGTTKFKKYLFPRNTGSLASNYTIDRTTGANFVVSDLVMVFSRMETTKRVEIEALTKGDLAAIVKDANGKYWYLGYDEPLVASAGDGLTGTQRADRNGYSITLQDNSDALPYEVPASVAAGVIG